MDCRHSCQGRVQVTLFTQTALMAFLSKQSSQSRSLTSTTSGFSGVRMAEYLHALLCRCPIDLSMGITERRLQVSRVHIRCKTIPWGPGVEEDISYCLWLDCMHSSPTSAFCASVRTESTAVKMHNWQHEKKNIHHFSFEIELKESGEKSEGVDVLKVPGEKMCSCKRFVE